MTIPVSNVVQVNPGVLSAGGSLLSLNGLLMSQSLLIPTATVQTFGSPAAVSTFFGPSSTEYAIAQTYFAGFDNSTLKPGILLVAPFNLAARAGWVQSGSLAAMSLTQLQALGSGTLIVTVDGVVKTSGTISLAAVASFTAAATAIAAAFSGTPLTCVWNAVNSTFTLTSVTTGATSTMTYCTGTLSTGLLLTSATGAILSQGAVIDTPTTAMNNAKAITQAWAMFMTLWEPVTADKQLFAAWVSTQNSRYGYIAWDTDAQAIVNGSTTCFGVLANALAYDTVIPVYNTVGLAAFVLGVVASIDFSRANGRITAAFKALAGFPATVTDEQISLNLLANGYSYYGSYGTVPNSFLYDGHVSGRWKWLDTFANQIYLNASFKSSLLNLLLSVPSIPYNQNGFSLIRAAMQTPINNALNFGSIRTGITLTEAQKAQVNQAAGLDVSQILQLQGYYLQVLDPGAAVRAVRGTPVVNFWYTDGGAVQKITVSSVDIF